MQTDTPHFGVRTITRPDATPVLKGMRANVFGTCASRVPFGGCTEIKLFYQ